MADRLPTHQPEQLIACTWDQLYDLLWHANMQQLPDRLHITRERAQGAHAHVAIRLLTLATAEGYITTGMPND